MSEVKTHHKQVPFLTAEGHLTEVDEGLYEILTLLRENGVRTQYSCQGNDPFGAYVLGDFQSFYRLARKIRTNYRKGHYSLSSRAVIRSFKTGFHSYELRLFLDRGTDERWTGVFKRGKKTPESYAVERSLDNYYKARLVFRWPKEDTPKVLKLLQEVSGS